MIFDVNEFISKEITKRPKSLMSDDIGKFHGKIRNEIRGKSVLIIGAAGTIGSSFLKSLLNYEPAKVFAVDINENGLTELVRDCRSDFRIKMPEIFKTYPINFSDSIFRKIFIKEGPFNIVANFAAHKHVRSEKDIYSIEAMINNNVIATSHLLKLLVKFPPNHFFCVSTDKAANPVNVMGASKKLMENLLLAYSNKIKITTARFANVAFSNGSLLDGFIERIMKGQPLSCPDNVRRFFVSPIEAGEICLCACVLGKSGDIFFPKIDSSELTAFTDIVPSILSVFKFQPEICKSEDEAKSKLISSENRYPVYFFESSTNGEKLYEEFYTSSEVVDMHRFSSLGVISNSSRTLPIKELEKGISTMKRLFSRDDLIKNDIIVCLKSLVPDFQHIETGVNLDEKM